MKKRLGSCLSGCAGTVFRSVPTAARRTLLTTSSRRSPASVRLAPVVPPIVGCGAAGIRTVGVSSLSWLAPSSSRPRFPFRNGCSRCGFSTLAKTGSALWSYNVNSGSPTSRLGSSLIASAKRPLGSHWHPCGRETVVPWLGGEPKNRHADRRVGSKQGLTDKTPVVALVHQKSGEVPALGERLQTMVDGSVGKQLTYRPAP